MLHSNWYLLPNTEKRYMLLMLSKAQKPTTMKAGTMPLNLDTFVSVCIRIHIHVISEIDYYKPFCFRC